jgi:hypothetical protein
MSSTRASLITRFLCWQGSSVPCTCFTRRGGYHLGGCFECGDTIHFIADCPKRKKLDSSNKYNYTKQNDYSKYNNKKKNHFGDNKKKKFQKIMSRACAALSNFDFLSDDSSSLEENEKVKRKKGDFTDL